MSLPISGVSRVLSSHAAANSIASAAAVTRAATTSASGAQAAAAMPAVNHGHFAQALNAAHSPVATPAPTLPPGLP